MGLGERGKHRIEGNALKVNELFKPTETTGTAASAVDTVPGPFCSAVNSRPKGEAVKVKSFALPVGLNQRLRRFAFEQERSEVDVVRAALDAYLDAQDR